MKRHKRQTQGKEQTPGARLPRSREQAIERARAFLLRHGWPRAQMSLAVMLTGCAGFLVSVALLRAGVTQMWLRYPLAICAAYIVFLLLLRLWLYLHNPRRREPDVDLDGADVALDLGDGARGTGFALGDSAGGPDAVGAVFGGGGDFAGGGAGGSWSDAASVSAGQDLSVGGGSGLLDSLDLDLGGGDDGCGALLAVIALVAAVIGGLVASFYVVYAAPALLAEILVDGLLVAGLYKQLKGVEQRHWLRAAVSKTLLPMLLVLLFFTLAGYAMHRAVPEAHSIGGFWQGLSSEQPPQR